MAAVNTKRVLIGALAGGVVWNAWSLALNYFVLAPRYDAAQGSGFLLLEPLDYSPTVFIVGMVVMVFVLSFIVTWFYASVRATRGAGPGPALEVGALIGIMAAIPVNYTIASWGTFGRGIPFFWALDMFVGCLLAALIGGWLYKS
jgi:hypothetical protein